MCIWGIPLLHGIHTVRLFTIILHNSIPWPQLGDPEGIDWLYSFLPLLWQWLRIVCFVKGWWILLRL